MTEVDTKINTSVTKEQLAPSEFKNPKEQEYFPPLINEVFSGQAPPLYECPSTIGISGTKFEDLLATFDAEREEDIQKWDRAVKLRSKLFSKTGIEEPEEIRSRHLDYEYLQRIYDFDGNIRASKLIKGKQNEVHPFGKKGKSDRGPEKHFQKIRATIHNHPDGTTFSPPDIDPFFVESLLPESQASQKDELPKVHMLVVSNKYGHFLTFPTRETLLPSQLDREIDGISGDGHWLQTNMNNAWETLRSNYSERQLQPYVGEKAEHKGSEVFPRETNDIGDELVTLKQFLDLSEKYKLPLYFMEKDKSEFQRISSVEDYYPDLK